jgi:hypothetical protein
MAGLGGLDPRFAPVAEALVTIMRAWDARFVVTSGLRTRAEQQQLYERMLRAKAAGEPYLTTLPPGRSQHERGLAIDVARFGIEARNDDLLREFGAAWREIGGTWGGDSDPVHFGAPKGW